MPISKFMQMACSKATSVLQALVFLSQSHLSALLVFAMAVCNCTPGAQGATFNVKSYGALGNGVHDDDPAINSAVAAAKAARAGSVVYFPAGTYLLYSGADAHTHIDLSGATNLTVQGDSTTNTLLVSGDATKRWFMVENCANVTMLNFSMDAVPLGFTQGTITSRDRLSNRKIRG
jgi:polygalacturonase